MNDERDFNFPLTGFRAASASTEWVTEIHFTNDKRKEVVLQIENSIMLKTTNGKSIIIKPGSEAMDCRPLADSLSEGPVNISIRENGSVDVFFEKGSSINVSSSEEFEPWNLTSSDGLRIVSMPGGRLSVWEI